MVKSATVDRIYALSKQGKTTTQIQRQLRSEGRGIRRTVLLAYVREAKGRKPRADVYKYTPRKYRRPITPPTPKKYHVSAYGKHKQKSKRYEVFATTKKALYRFLIDGAKHPPKQRIARIDIDRVRGLSDRAKYIDYGEEWDERPTIKS